MRRERSSPRIERWGRRLFAAGVVAVFHIAIFGLIARDWAMHRASSRLDAVEITLERADRPRAQEALAEERPPALQAPQAVTSNSAVAPLTGPETAASPFATARPAATSPPGSPPAAGLALNTGCLGRARELMSAAERRRCDEERSRMATAPAYTLPGRMPPTALDREFAAAWAKRRENDPRPRAPRPTNCQLANITNCEPEDSTLVLFDGHGTGAAQVLKRRITGEKLPETPPSRAASVFGREEITFTPAPMK